MTAVLVLCAILAAGALTWSLCRAAARRDTSRSRNRGERLHHIAFRKPPSRRVLSRSARREPPDA